MCGLVGAATIIGCLKYGACFSGQNEQDDPVFLIRLKDEELVEAPDDSAFLQSLRHSCARVNGVYPPMSLIEAYITEDDSAPGVRRLHLIVVDLHRRGQGLESTFKPSNRSACSRDTPHPSNSVEAGPRCLSA